MTRALTTARNFTLVLLMAAPLCGCDKLKSAVGKGDGAGGAFMCSFEEKIKVLAGYHAGPGAVEKYGGLPPYETTRAYVTAVLQRYEEYRRREAALSAWVGAAPMALR